MVCKGRTYNCPIALCGATRLKDLEEHWANECPKVNLTCSSCQIVLKRDAIPNHNCVKTLLEEKAVDKAIIAKQKEENKVDKAIIAKQKAENKMYQDEAKQHKAAEEEQAAIIAKQKAEIEILKAQANQQKAAEE